MVTPVFVPRAERDGILVYYQGEWLASIFLPIVTSPATYSNRQPSDQRERRVRPPLPSLDTLSCRVGSSQREVRSLVLPLAIQMHARLRHSLKQDRA